MVSERRFMECCTGKDFYYAAPGFLLPCPQTYLTHIHSLPTNAHRTLTNIWLSLIVSTSNKSEYPAVITFPRYNSTIGSKIVADAPATRNETDALINETDATGNETDATGNETDALINETSAMATHSLAMVADKVALVAANLEMAIYNLTWIADIFAKPNDSGKTPTDFAPNPTFFSETGSVVPACDFDNLTLVADRITMVADWSAMVADHLAKISDSIAKPTNSIAKPRYFFAKPTFFSETGSVVPASAADILKIFHFFILIAVATSILSNASAPLTPNP